MEKKPMLAGLCAAIILGGLAGCQAEKKDVKLPVEDKTVVTVLYYTELSGFEALVERIYPDIDLQYERTVTATIEGDLSRRLNHGQGPDLIIGHQPVNQDMAEYVIDLSAEPFSERYDGTMLSAASLDGKTYCLPLPGQYYGYMINTTLLEEAGEEIPATEQDLIGVLTRMQQKGIGVGEDGSTFGIWTVANAELGSYLVGCMVPDFLGTMEGESWLAAFRDKAAVLSEEWGGCFSTLDTLSMSGAFNPTRVSRQNNALPIGKRLGGGELVVAYGNSGLLNQVREANENYVKEGTAKPYEYQLLPLLSSGGNPPWVISSPSGYISINSSVDGEDNKGKKDACLRVLDLLSTEEGQQVFSDDARLNMTYLVNSTIQSAGSTDGLDACIEGGYVYGIRLPGQVIEYLGNLAFQQIAGQITTEELLKQVDDYYYHGSEEADYDLSIVGTVAEDLLYESYNVRKEETALGNLVADSVAEFSGAPIAVVNGGGIRGSLYAGDVLGGDLQEVCPFDNKIVVLEMSGQTMWDMIQNGLASIWVNEIPNGRFLQVSGISYEFIVTAKPDSDQQYSAALVDVALADGKPLDRDGVYQVAVNDYMAGSKGYLDNSGDGYTMLNVYCDTTPKAKDAALVKETQATYRDALKVYFDNHRDEEINPVLEGRITAQLKE